MKKSSSTVKWLLWIHLLRCILVVNRWKRVESDVSDLRGSELALKSAALRVSRRRCRRKNLEQMSENLFIYFNARDNRKRVIFMIMTATEFRRMPTNHERVNVIENKVNWRFMCKKTSPLTRSALTTITLSNALLCEDLGPWIELYSFDW